MLAVYMPLIRSGVTEYVQNWNHHSIRKQNDRPEGVYGQPYKMFEWSKEPIIDYGMVPDKDLLSELSNAHSYWGKTFLIKVDTSLADTSIDIDEYLPGQTLEWCRSILTELGFSDLKYEDVFTNGDRIHTQAYLQLRNYINNHIVSGSRPILEESQKPTQERGFHPDLDAAIDQVCRSQSDRLGLNYNLHREE
jgi:hypothetical protein